MADSFDLTTIGAREEWHTFSMGPDGTAVEFLIYMLDTSERREIALNRLGKVQDVGKIDVAKVNASVLEQGRRALRDSRGKASVRVGSDAARDKLRKILDDHSIETGTSVVLDGRWNDAVRAHVLAEAPKLLSWIIERLDAAQRAADEDELGKGTTS